MLKDFKINNTQTSSVSLESSLLAQQYRIHLPMQETGDTGSIPGLGRFPGVGNGNSFKYLDWKILWTEEPGGL